MGYNTIHTYHFECYTSLSWWTNGISFFVAPNFPKIDPFNSSILYKLSFWYFRGNLYFCFSEFARPTSRRFDKNSASTRWDGQSNWFNWYIHLWKFERKTGYWCKKWNIKTRTDQGMIQIYSYRKITVFPKFVGPLLIKYG